MVCEKSGCGKSLKSTPNSTKAKGLKRALFGSKGTKLKPASIEAQKAWQGFPAGLKKELRRTLPDRDRDGVHNGFDCRPRNKKRQEAFLPVDAAYLNSNPEIRLGEKIGGGAFGMCMLLWVTEIWL